MRLGRERILVGGPSGTSKTYSFLKRAQHQPMCKNVIIQADDGLARCIEEFPQFGQLAPQPAAGKLTVLPNCVNWGNFYNGVSQVAAWVKTGLLGSQDWVSVEGWDIICLRQRHEMADASNVNGKAEAVVSNVMSSDLQPSSWEQFLDKRRANKPFLIPGDYDAIYTELEKPLTYLCFQMPCNLWSTTELTPLRTGGEYQDSQDVKDFYLSMGMTSKFDGYKFIPRWHDTLLQTGRDIKGQYNVKVWKDRGNQVPVNPIVNGDFYVDVMQRYLHIDVGQQMVMAPPPPVR